MSSISSANSSFVIVIGGLFDVPQIMQGYDVDEAFSAEAIDVAETKIGVDGVMSYGFTYAITPMTITLQADSPSITMFEAWRAAELAASDKYSANAVITLPSVGTAYVLTTGVLKSYSPMPEAKKILQPRKFMLHWQSVIGAPV